LQSTFNNDPSYAPPYSSGGAVGGIPFQEAPTYIFDIILSSGGTTFEYNYFKSPLHIRPGTYYYLRNFNLSALNASHVTVFHGIVDIEWNYFRY
jgi:hypothetical protein